MVFLNQILGLILGNIFFVLKQRTVCLENHIHITNTGYNYTVNVSTMS